MNYGGRFWIIYNGEIYNYVELRTELQGLGHQFHSQCDTEVILAAFSQWGTGCFQRFNGMWAMAIYDSTENRLILSRDRFGVKPLYYWQNRDQFAFASEIKAFTCLPGWRARANGQTVHDFLISGIQDHSAETMFAEVRQLEPGHYARLNCADWAKPVSGASSSRPETVRWYELRPKPFDGTLSEASQRFRDLFVDSVRLRLRSDVPVGSCLSGGLDSSSIVCATHQILCAKETRCAHKTFSACSEIKRFDEREFIEHVVQAAKLQSHLVFPSLTDLFRELDAIILHQDEPFAGTSIYAQWCVFKKAAESDIKVMLDGQGADESLCGYHDFRRAFYCGLLRSGRFKLTWDECLAARGDKVRAAEAFLRASLDALTPAGTQVFVRKVASRQRNPPWLQRSACNATFHSPLTARFRRYKSAREMSLELLTGAHLQMLLHWEDRNSMAHSLESRVPFLDYGLVEFVTGLPDHYKIRNGITKTVLRQGMKDLVPAPVLERRDKMAFVTPEEVWAKEAGGKMFRNRLAEAVSACHGMISSEAVSYFEAFLSGQRNYDPVIWRIICLGSWMRIFNVAV
jgi:asparagine synthase (glutamine-hydrolysing)